MDKPKVTEQAWVNVQIVTSVYQQVHAMYADSSQEPMKNVLVHLQVQFVMLTLQLASLMIRQWKKKQYVKDAHNQVRL